MISQDQIFCVTFTSIIMLIFLWLIRCIDYFTFGESILKGKTRLLFEMIATINLVYFLNFSLADSNQQIVETKEVGELIHIKSYGGGHHDAKVQLPSGEIRSGIILTGSPKFNIEEQVEIIKKENRSYFGIQVYEPLIVRKIPQ